MLGMLATDYMRRRHEIDICCADRRAQTSAALRERKAAKQAEPASAFATRCVASGQPGHTAGCVVAPATPGRG